MAVTKIDSEQELVTVASKNSALYSDVSLAALTAYSLYWLHRWELRRSIEAVAVLNWRLFPNKFGMVGFPQYPDAFRTNRSLLQGQPKYRNLLTGAASKGFSLNERGMEVARQLVSKLGVPAKADGIELGVPPTAEERSSKKQQIRTLEPKEDVRRVRESKLFEKWSQAVMSDRDLIHVHSLLGVFDHTPAKVRSAAMRQLESSANEVGDEDARRFLADVRHAFPVAFREKGNKQGRGN
ncbi:MAG: hypothetical protein ABSH00_04375 [Bryobacteraceae bacterium]